MKIILPCIDWSRCIWARRVLGCRSAPPRTGQRYCSLASESLGTEMMSHFNGLVGAVFMEIFGLDLTI